MANSLERGKIILTDGEDRMGKTTATLGLVDRWNREVGPANYWHEPGGTEIGLIVEKIVKSTTIPKDIETQVMLFTLARAAGWHEIEKGLENGESYFFDRSWISTVVYQGMAGGYGVDRVKEITEEYMPPEYVYPAYTFIIDPTDAHRQKMQRLLGVNQLDFFESKPDSFQQALRQGYQELPPGFVQFRRRIGSQVLQTAEIFRFEGEIEEIQERMWGSLEEHVLRAA